MDCLHFSNVRYLRNVVSLKLIFLLLKAYRTLRFKPVFKADNLSKEKINEMVDNTLIELSKKVSCLEHGLERPLTT